MPYPSLSFRISPTNKYQWVLGCGDTDQRLGLCYGFTKSIEVGIATTMVNLIQPRMVFISGRKLPPPLPHHVRYTKNTVNSATLLNNAYT